MLFSRDLQLLFESKAGKLIRDVFYIINIFEFAERRTMNAFGALLALGHCATRPLPLSHHRQP